MRRERWTNETRGVDKQAKSGSKGAKSGSKRVCACLRGLVTPFSTHRFVRKCTCWLCAFRAGRSIRTNRPFLLAVCCVLTRTPLLSMCGTPEYMAPEVLMQKGHGFTVDWWGLGMLVFEMFTGLPPWYTTDKTKLFKRLKSAVLVIPNFISGESASFVRGLLERDPSKRLGVLGEDSVKKHPFFAQVVWSTLLAKKLTPPIRPCEGLKLPETRSSPMPISGINGDSKGAGLDTEVVNNDTVRPSDYGYSMSPDTIDATTQNFDPAFTKLSVNTNDDSAEAGGSVGGSGVSDDEMFTGFSYDQQVKMKLVR